MFEVDELVAACVACLDETDVRRAVHETPGPAGRAATQGWSKMSGRSQERARTSNSKDPERVQSAP
jgi:hypothetical protein